MENSSDIPTFFNKLNAIRSKSNPVIPESTEYTSTSHSKSSLNQIYNSMQPFFNFVKEICDDNPDVTNNDLIEYITSTLNKLNFKYANCTSFRSDSIRLDICNYFKNNPAEFRKIYRELIDTEKETRKQIHSDPIIKYSSNQEISKRQLMSQLITTFREIRDSFPPEIQTFLSRYAKSSPKHKRALRDAQSTRESKEYIAKNEMFFMDEFEGLNLFLKDQTDFFSQELKKDYIESIKSMILTLQSLGVTQKYIATNNKLMVDTFHIPELEITPEEFKNVFNETRNSTSPLEHLDIPTLSVLNSFWINRVTKELSSFSDAFFITNDLNLWDKIRTAEKKSVNSTKASFDDADDVFLETKIEVPISEEELDALIEKMKFLEKESSYYFLLASSSTDINELEDNEIVDPYTGNIQRRKSAVYRDLSQEAQILDSQIGEDYHNYFSKVNNGVLADSENDFLTDFYLYCTAANITHNSYLIKDNIMISQLSNLFNSPTVSKNWGLTEDLRRKGFNHDKLLISIDAPGLNMPLRLHIRRELLEDFLRANQNTTRIPLYQGASDFYKGKAKNSGYIPTPVLIPVSPEKKKEIKKLASLIDETHPKYGFIEHISFIANGTSIPPHLKDYTSSKKTGPKARKKFIPRFYDFADGKVYKIVGNNQIVEDPEFLQGGKNNVK